MIIQLILLGADVVNHSITTYTDGGGSGDGPGKGYGNGGGSGRGYGSGNGNGYRESFGMGNCQFGAGNGSRSGYGYLNPYRRIQQAQTTIETTIPCWSSKQNQP